MITLLEIINGLILAPLVPIILFSVGIYFAIKLRFFFVRYPIRTIMPLTKRPPGSGVSPLAAVTLALAGTLGVGNIVGVATAIILGGAGAVFWMWVSAIVAMVLKYAEILLAVRHRREKEGKFHGGAMYYIKSRKAAVTFALLCILCSFSLGNALQVNAAAQSAGIVFGLPVIAVGGAFAVLVYLVIFRHKKGVFDFTLKLVPAITVFYIILALVVIFAQRQGIPGVISQIFSAAFNFRSAAGGVGGFLIAMSSVRFGVIRGLVSNEAGCGTAPIAHAAADVHSPAAQGCWGIVEVFVDTLLMCTLTAFVILLPGFDLSGAEGMGIVLSSFAYILGGFAETALAASIFAFAFATIIGWSFFGMECVHYLSPTKRAKTIYLVVFNIVALVGGFLNPDLIWHLSDFTIGGMTIINGIALFFMRDEVFQESRKFFRWK
ncbi:MAG: amino acid carrier protein [Oscillospiraceae bacterium]|nr:amino acid carrier protein [Oscillospiraceae bacterium]